jgi:signal transduction histidine kinase
VADTGAGIAENELTKIFERFYRCDRSRSMGGIGLGLSLAKAIVMALGGDIQVESTLGQGSLFTVSLPYD